VRGHVHYGIHRYIPKECSYATFLREPVSRVLSLYKYVRRTAQHPLHQRLTDMGLEDFIASGLDQAQTQNGQTRQICGQTDTDPDLATLQRAKQNLQSFAAVGLMEQFLESVVLFRRSLDWRIPPIYMTQNVAPSLDLDVSDQALALIRERNELDLELYEVARSLFVERLERYGRSFSKEVTLMKALNRIPNARLTQSLLNSPLRRKLQKGIARSGGER
jgi:hypothetical protein